MVIGAALQLLRFTGITALRVMATGQTKHMICIEIYEGDRQTHESDAFIFILSSLVCNRIIQ